MEVEIFYKNDPYLKIHCQTKKEVIEFLQRGDRIVDIVTKDTPQKTVGIETRRHILHRKEETDENHNREVVIKTRQTKTTRNHMSKRSIKTRILNN